MNNNQQLVNSIIFGDIINNIDAIEMAYDVRIMTHFKCCMKDEITHWEYLEDTMVAAFQSCCDQFISSAPVSVQEKWNDMNFEDQIQVILGDEDCNITQTCGCTCTTSGA